MTQTVLIYEDPVHEMILEKIFGHLGLDIGVCSMIPSGGKSRIDANLERYANAARNKRVVILRDMDNDADCAPVLKTRLLSGVNATNPVNSFVFRLIVREAEAWLLSDKNSCQSFFKLRRIDVQGLRPETLRHPKEQLLMLIDRGGLSTRRKAEFCTRSGGVFYQAPTYNDAIRPYMETWSVLEAMTVSDSLARAVRSIRESFEDIEGRLLRV